MPAHDDDRVPPGWDYNPATWQQRLPIVGMALIGFGIAMYLSLYQWGVFEHIWDPFFGTPTGGGSQKILQQSSISKLTMKYLGVPDGFLGALGYVADAVAGVIGGTRRWKTMPWIVILFGVAVGPLGLVSILLVIFQPVLFNAFCTLCLATALISVSIIGPAMDEVLASLQYMQRARRAGRSLWRVFWGLS